MGRGKIAWIRLSAEESRAVEAYFSSFTMPEIMNMTHTKKALRSIVRWHTNQKESSDG